MDNKISFSIESIIEGYHKVSYRGIKLIKDSFDYLLYQMIINEVKPNSIIKIGANKTFLGNNEYTYIGIPAKKLEKNV